MPRTIEKTIYTLDELAPEARAKAIDRHREWNVDHDWWEDVYAQAEDAAKYLGIVLGTRPVPLVSGATRHDPAACRADFAKDEELHRLADELLAIYEATAGRVRVNVDQNGRYSHEHTMTFEFICGWDDGDDEFVQAARDAVYTAERVEERLAEAMRDFARWIYARLEEEYEHLTSDECIADGLIANEMEFDEDGDPV